MNGNKIKFLTEKSNMVMPFFLANSPDLFNYRREKKQFEVYVIIPIQKYVCECLNFMKCEYISLNIKFGDCLEFPINIQYNWLFIKVYGAWTY